MADCVGDEVFTVDPGPNDVFDGIASLGGDDIVTRIDTLAQGVSDPEGIASLISYGFVNQFCGASDDHG